MPAKNNIIQNFTFDIKSIDIWEDGVIILSPDGNVLFTNKAWKHFSEKYEPGSQCTEGSDFFAFCDEHANINSREKIKLIENGIKEVISGKSSSFNTEYSYKYNGNHGWFLLKVHPLSSEVPTGVLLQHIDITETKNKIQDSEELLTDICQIARIGGWEFEVESGKGNWTPQVARIHELDLDISTNPDFGMTFYAPGSREIIEEAIQNVIEKGRPYDLELEFITAKGTQKWVRTTGHPKMSEGKVVKVTGSLQDITDRKNAEKALEMESMKRRILIEQSADGIVIIDQNGKVFEANKKFADMLGYTEKEMSSLHMWDWDTQYTREQLLEMVRLADEVGVTHETKQRCKDGTLLDVEISGNGAIFGNEKLIFCVCRDITDRKNTEEALIHAKQMAEEASDSKSEFLATMSHELRTPLNSIIGFSDIMSHQIVGELNDKQSEYIDHIANSGKHLLGLINSILDFSKIEAGKMEICCCPFCVGDVVEEVRATTIPIAEVKNININVSVEPDLIMNADKTKFKQILYNLVSNAIKFTEKGGTISINIKRVDDMIHTSVKDNGIGISGENTARLFEPFKQLSKYSTREQGGTGLGLTIVKKYVEMHKGKIWVQSKPGQGSTFAFVIPAESKMEVLNL
ncbi:PAS domain S-box protein [Methanolobus sediminis]|uniref:histidine kinase n=1 Tax=Methanolobus sediminis TaxID=3072978 RepID=A0AA51UK84_9EURY|nr:PAS domain S-box protein [Methanolobus sediminis]WMW24945.1 PAS domain S-box protein [Methanolobus sediminis]